VNEFEFKPGDKILDPACGSGSFLRAIIHRIRECNSDITAEEISTGLYGIDIHPLSVQIAKTTVLLALGREITKAGKPVHINVILANTLLAPEGVENLFSLKEKFDYIIGNPPWITYNSVKNKEYQNQLKDLAEKYNVKPLRAANMPHLEIAAIFMAHCSSFFLNEKGKISFVLPRSFFSADHHTNTRSGEAKGFCLTQIWDLDKVSPLFRVPACVLFAGKSKIKKPFPAAGLSGISFSGRLPVHNCNLNSAKTKVKEEECRWYYIKQGSSTAFSTRTGKSQNKVNPYKSFFKKGATIVPRAFYFIQTDMAFEKGWEKDFDWKDRMLHIRTSDDIQTDAKVPWKGLKLSGKMESRFIFRTAISKSILPFALYKPDLVVLPVTVETDKSGRKQIRLYSAPKLSEQGYRYAAQWFANAEKIWKIHRTQKNEKISSENYLNWNSKVTQQNLNAPYLVLYNTSAKDANATVVKRQELDLEFIADSKEYGFATADLEEAYFLAAVLNSTAPNLMMKDFQSKGLFGARDVCKKILDIYWPKFDGKNRTHLQLSELSRKAHDSVAKFLADNIATDQKIEGIPLGKLRVEIKAHLHKEMKEIDNLVKEIME